MESSALISTSFGERLRIARTRRRKQAQALAREVGVSHTAIGKWELDQGGPRPEQVKSLAAALDVSPMWLLYGDATEGGGPPLTKWYEAA